jgi:hypothetical protein
MIRWKTCKIFNDYKFTRESWGVGHGPENTSDGMKIEATNTAGGGE